MENNPNPLAKLLIQQNLTLATCESLTGGLFATVLTETSGISQVLKGVSIGVSNDFFTRG